MNFAFSGLFLPSIFYQLHLLPSSIVIGRKPTFYCRHQIWKIDHLCQKANQPNGQSIAPTRCIPRINPIFASHWCTTPELDALEIWHRAAPSQDWRQSGNLPYSSILCPSSPAAQSRKVEKIFCARKEKMWRTGTLQQNLSLSRQCIPV